MKNNNLIRRIAAVLLAVMLLCLVGCKEEPAPSKKDPSTSSKPSSSQQGTTSTPSSSTNSGSSETTSSNKKPSSTVIKADPLDGNISYNANVTESNKRDDADEYFPDFNCANVGAEFSHFKGGYEAEADAYRERILNTPNTEEIYGDKMTGNIYYVSPGGDDKNDGLSPETPLRTIESLSNIEFEKGDAVLFERNSIFRLLNQFNTTEGVIYGAYGEGDKPQFLGSALNYANCEWKPAQRKNVWRTNYVYSEACSVVFDHGKEIGYRKTSIRALEKNTDFYQDEQGAVIYIYCDKGNPADVYKSIDVAQRQSGFVVPGHSGDVIIDNICIKYIGVLGIELHFNNHDVIVTNCEVGYVGGAVFGGGLRYGNGIQAWQGVQNLTVENCWIYQTFDAAFSWQGMGQGTEDQYHAKYTDVRVNNNLFEFNDVDIELWDANELLGGVHEYNNNIHRFTSLGWGTRADDGGFRGLEGAFGNCTTGDMDIQAVVEVHDMIVDCPGREIFSWYVYGTGRNADMGADTWNYHDFRGTKAYINMNYRTFSRSLRGCRRTASDSILTSYHDEASLIESLKRFDPSIQTVVVK